MKKIKKIFYWLAIVTLVFQASGLFNIQTAQADSNNITQIKFTTSEQVIPIHTIAKLTTQTQNTGNTSELVSETTTLNLSSTSLTGEFSSSNTSWLSTTTLTMSSGTTNRNFYYRDNAPGNYTLTISAQGKSWTAATQAISVINLCVNPAGSDGCYSAIQTAIDNSINGDSVNIAAGTYSETMTVNKSISLIGAGATTIINPAQNSDGIKITANNVTIKNLKITTANSGISPNIAINIQQTTGVDIVNVTIETSGNKAMGIWIGGSSNSLSPSTNLKIRQSKITINGVATGIYASHSNPAHSGWTIGGSLADGNSVTASSGNPIELYDVSASEVSYNTLTITSAIDSSNVIWSSELSNLSNLAFNNNIVSGSSGSEVAILNDFPTNETPATTVSTAAISGNTFSNWGSRALRIGAGVSGVTVSNNKFMIASQTAILKNENSSASVDAVNNWWGSEDPDFNSLISGSVSYTPWYVDSALSAVSAKPAVPQITKIISTNSTKPKLTWSAVSAKPAVKNYLVVIDGVTPVSVGTNNYYQIETALTEGSHTWKAKAQNSMGDSDYSDETFVVDIQAPYNGLLAINSGVEVTNSRTIELSISAIDIISGVDKMLISEKADFSDSQWENYATSKTFILSTGDGQKTIYTKFKDLAGNESTAIATDTIFLGEHFANSNVNNPSVNPVSQTERSIDKLADLGLTLEVSENISGAADLTVGQYQSNPGSALSNGITGVGKYFDISSSNTTVFPLMIKIYYTTADLAAAGIDDETKLLGIYYYDSASASWQLYPDTGVNTADTVINNIAYAGYVWANAEHLTPITFTADITAPATVANLKAEVQSTSAIKLTWDKVADAAYYLVRYKIKNSTGDYTVVTLDAVNNSTLVSGLAENTEYEFGVASQDLYKNISAYQSVTATTAKTAAAAAITILVETAQAASPAATSEEATTIITKPRTTTTTTIAPQEQKGEIKSEETKAAGNRTLVTIIILLIALGAGVGGYYGYEWWLVAGETRSGKGRRPKNDDTTGRW